MTNIVGMTTTITNEQRRALIERARSFIGGQADAQLEPVRDICERLVATHDQGIKAAATVRTAQADLQMSGMLVGVFTDMLHERCSAPSPSPSPSPSPVAHKRKRRTG